MSLHRYRAPMAVLASISVCLLMAAAPAMADTGLGAHKLEGAWVAKVIGAPGQWSYVVTADPSGKRASAYGNIDAGLNLEAILGPVFEPADHSSPLLIETVMQDRDTAKYYCVYYGLKTLALPSPVNAEIVYIGVVKGTLEFTAPGKAKGTHNFEIYYPSQDKDGDGFPDADETTPFVFQLLTNDTRLPSP